MPMAKRLSVNVTAEAGVALQKYVLPHDDSLVSLTPSMNANEPFAPTVTDTVGVAPNVYGMFPNEVYADS